MGHRASYTERLEIRDGTLHLIKKASWKGQDLDVYDLSITDQYPMIRNLSFTYLSGWVFNAPKDKCNKSNYYSYYQWDGEYGVGNWWECSSKCSIVGTTEMDNQDIEKILIGTQYEEFKYTLRAMNFTSIGFCTKVFETILQWSKNSKVELLIKLGLNKLIQSKSFMKLDAKRQRQVVQLIQDGKAPKDANPKNLIFMVNHNCSYRASIVGGDERLASYLEKQDVLYEVYKEYLHYANLTNHNIQEEYWKYPSNFYERNGQVREQYNNIQDAIKLAKIENENKKIVEVAQSLSSLNTTIDGYSIEVAQSLNDIQEQAKKLNQCLITCKYYQSYADKKCILVFVKKGTERLATCEVFYDKARGRGQFYGNERDRNNCKPSQEITNAFDLWFNQVWQPSNISVGA